MQTQGAGSPFSPCLSSALAIFSRIPSLICSLRSVLSGSIKERKKEERKLWKDTTKRFALIFQKQIRLDNEKREEKKSKKWHTEGADTKLNPKHAVKPHLFLYFSRRATTADLFPSLAMSKAVFPFCICVFRSKRHTQRPAWRKSNTAKIMW